MQGHFDTALRWAERAERQARRWTWSAILPDAIAAIAQIHYERGDQTTAIERFEEAMELYEHSGHVEGVADCLLGDRRGGVPLR